MNKPQSVKDLEKVRDKLTEWKGKINLGHELSKEINSKLDDLTTKVKKFIQPQQEEAPIFKLLGVRWV